MITVQNFRANQNLVVDGHLLKPLFGSGLLWLEYNKEKVNQLNVFPVPDGDTGTNMYLTMRHAYDRIALLEEPHVGRLSQLLADGALMGARGNSGVILSQIWAGVAQALDGHAQLDARLLAQACQQAVAMAYRAVEQPVEGTILTVSRMMMEAVVTRYEETPNLIALLRRMLVAGRAALRATPDLLPVLKKAGVVDSGGQGLLLIFEGMLRSLCGREITRDAAVQLNTQAWRDTLAPEDDEGYGYDVQFLMRGDGLSMNDVKLALARMGGWSTLVVGSERLLKVHVHVHDPGEPLSYAIRSGAAIEDIVVENMQAQYEANVRRRDQQEASAAPVIRTDVEGVAVITVAAGAGMHQVMNDFGAAYVIDGGQTMNPSTGDFLTAIQALPNHEIILLPNNKNIILAAQQAAQQAEAHSHRRVEVLPTMSLPQGIAAMIEYANLHADGTLDSITEAITNIMSDVICCEITHAVRAVELEGVNVREGQLIGLLNNRLIVADDDMFTVALELLTRANVEQYERVTLYHGEQVSWVDAETLSKQLSAHFAELEFEVVCGSQPLYPYIISIE